MQTDAMPHGSIDVEAPSGAPAAPAVTRLRRYLTPVDAWIRGAAEAQPMVALAVALGLGYVAGRLIRRIAR